MKQVILDALWAWVRISVVYTRFRGGVMRLHGLRPKHDRHMALAESAVEKAAYFKRQGEPAKGWPWVQEAIRLVVECGCSRDLWPGAVRDVVKETTV